MQQSRCRPQATAFFVLSAYAMECCMDVPWESCSKGSSQSAQALLGINLFQWLARVHCSQRLQGMHMLMVYSNGLVHKLGFKSLHV